MQIIASIDSIVRENIKGKDLLVLSIVMNSKLPKWMLREPAGCFSNRSEEASQNKREEEEEMGTGKRPRRTVDSEGGVEEFLCLLERIEETKKQLQRKRSKNCSGGCSADHIAEEKNQIMVLQQQAQGSDFLSLQAPSSHWKPSFQWEDFNKNHMSVQTDLSCAATTETHNIPTAVFVSSTDENPRGGGGGGSSVQIGKGQLKTRSLLDIISAATPAGCSYDLNNEDVDAPPELELRLFPI